MAVQYPFQQLGGTATALHQDTGRSFTDQLHGRFYGQEIIRFVNAWEAINADLTFNCQLINKQLVTYQYGLDKSQGGSLCHGLQGIGILSNGQDKLFRAYLASAVILELRDPRQHYLFDTILSVSSAITNSSFVVTAMAMTFEFGRVRTTSLPRFPSLSD